MNDIKEIYRRNRFKMGDVDFSLSDIDSKNIPTERFAIVTAWNPNNQMMTTPMNRSRNRLLQQELDKRDMVYEKALGYLEDHSEESFCIYGISLEEALVLGKLYEQYAIFYCDGLVAGYYEVETSEQIVCHKIIH